MTGAGHTSIASAEVKTERSSAPVTEKRSSATTRFDSYQLTPARRRNGVLTDARWMYLFIVSRDVQLPILGMHSGEVLYRLKVWLHAVRWKLAMDDELDISCAARNLTANECRRPTGKRACRAAGAGMAGRDCVGQLEPHALSLGGCTLEAASSS